MLRVVAIPDKCELYCAGVYDEVKGKMCEVLEMAEGNLPFRYLGVPLSSKKLTYHECKPLLTKANRESPSLDQQVPIICWKAESSTECVIRSKVILGTTISNPQEVSKTSGDHL